MQIGLVSGWMFEKMTPGRTIHFRGVDGDFTLERRVPQPSQAGILLIAGGIGITPMRVILHNSIQRGIPSTLLYSVRNEADAVFLSQLLSVRSDSLCHHFSTLYFLREGWKLLSICIKQSDILFLSQTEVGIGLLLGSPLIQCQIIFAD